MPPPSLFKDFYTLEALEPRVMLSADAVGLMSLGGFSEVLDYAGGVGEELDPMAFPDGEIAFDPEVFVSLPQSEPEEGLGESDPGLTLLSEIDGAVTGLRNGLQQLAAFAENLGSQLIQGVQNVLITPLNAANPNILRTLGLTGVSIVEGGIYRLVIDGSIFDIVAGAETGITNASQLANAFASRVSRESNYAAEVVGNTLRLLPGDEAAGITGVGNLPISFSAMQDQGIFSQILPLIDPRGILNLEGMDPTRLMDFPQYAYGSLAEIFAFGEMITQRIVNPLRDFLLTQANTATVQDLVDLMQGLGMSIPGVDFVVDAAEVTGAYLQNTLEGIDELVFTLPFSFSRTMQYNLDLGSYAEMRGFGFAAEASGALALTASASASLTFGYDLSAGLAPGDRFFLRFGEEGTLFDLAVSASVNDLDVGLMVGPVRGEVQGGNGTLNFGMGFGLDPALLTSRGNLTGTAIAAAVGNLSALNLPAPSVASFDLLLPVSVSFEGIQLPSQSPSIRMHAANFLQALPEVEFHDFDRLIDFTSLTPQGILDLFRSFSELLPRMLNAPDFELKLPFAGELDLGRILNMVGTFADGFLDRLTDANGELRFPDLQTLLVVAQEIIGETGILQDFSFSYDGGERQLVFGFELSSSVLFEAEPFGFDFSTGPISLGVSNSVFQLSGSAGLVFELAVDLTAPKAMIAGSAEFSLPGNGVLSEAAQIEILLEGGAAGGGVIKFEVAPNAGNSSLEELASDVNAAIAATLLAGQIQARIVEGKLVFETTYSGPSPNFLIQAPGLLGFASARYAVEPPGAKVTLREFKATAAVALEASGLQASATLGFLDVIVGGGDANFAFEIELDFTPDGPRDFLALFNGLLSNPASLLPALNFQVPSGALALRQISVSTGLVGAPELTAEIRVGLKDGFNFPDDLSNPEMFEVVFDGNFDELLAFRDLDIDQILDLILQLAQRVADMTNVGIFTTQLPVVNVSIAEILDFSRVLLDAREQMMAVGARSIQRVRDLLDTALREALEPLVSDIEGLELTSNITWENQILGLEIRFEAGISRSFPFEVSLGGAVGNLIDLGGGANLLLDFLAVADLRMGINLANPESPEFLILQGTELAIELLLAANDIAFSAAIGPVGVFIGPGFVRLHDPDPDRERASLRLQVIPPSGNSVPIGDLLDALDLSIHGAFQVELPLYFPTRDAANQLGSLEIFFLLSDFDESFVVEFDLDIDWEDFFATFDLFATLGDGLELFFMAVEALLEGELFGIKLPFIGDQLKEVAEFILEIRDQIKLAFNAIQDPTEANIQAALMAVFGPDGLNLLPADLLPEELQVTLVMNEGIIDGVEVRLDLGGTVVLVDSNLVFDIGLPALGLALDAGLDILFVWSWTMGFGVTRTDGFYLLGDSDTPELTLSLSAGISEGSAMTGSLGILYFSATVRGEDEDNDPLTTGALLDFSLNFIPDSSGKLSMSEILSGNGLEIRLEGVMSMYLELEVGFANFQGEQLDSLPSFLVDFDITWNLFTFSLSDGASLGDAPVVNFTNMRLDLGSFFHDFLYPILRQINEYLEPIRPIVNFLNADISPLNFDPLSNIFDVNRDGKVTMLDLAELFGAIEPGTRNFIETVVTIVEILGMFGGEEGESSLPGRGERLLIPLGDFNFSALGLDLRSDSTSGVTLSEAMFSGPSFDSALSAFGDDGVTETFGKLKDADFEFLLLEPANLIKLLLGQDIEFFRFSPPQVGLSFTFVQSFIIYPTPMVKLVLSAGIGFTAQMTFGYDSSGIRRFLETQNPGDIFGGFYVLTGRERPLITFWGEIGGGASISFFVGVSAVAAVRVEVNISLYDPGNGKLYFSQIADLIQNIGFGPAIDCLFEISLAVTARVEIRVFLDLGIEITLLKINIGPVTFLGPFVKEAGQCFDGLIPDRLERIVDGRTANDLIEDAADLGFAPGIHLRGASLNRLGDVDWYRFEMPKDEEVVIELRGESAMEISLYDEEGNLLQVVEAGGSGVKRIRPGTLAAGIFFLRIWDPESETVAPYELDILLGASSATRIFYVAGGLANDPKVHSFYALGPGDDAYEDAGVDPKRPAATVARIFELHDPQPGDLILIDTGVYAEALSFGADAAGVFILGAPMDVYDRLPAEVVFGSTFTTDGTTPVITVQDTQNVTLGGIRMQNGEVAVLIQDATGTTLTRSEIVSFDSGVVGVGGIENTRISHSRFEKVRDGIFLPEADFARIHDLDMTGTYAIISTPEGNRFSLQGTAIRISGTDLILENLTLREVETGVLAEEVEGLVLRDVTMASVARAVILQNSESAALTRITAAAVPAESDPELFHFDGLSFIGLHAEDVNSLTVNTFRYTGHPEENDRHPHLTHTAFLLANISTFTGTQLRGTRVQTGLTGTGLGSFSMTGSNMDGPVTLEASVSLNVGVSMGGQRVGAPTLTLTAPVISLQSGTLRGIVAVLAGADSVTVSGTTFTHEDAVLLSAVDGNWIGGPAPPLTALHITGGDVQLQNNQLRAPLTVMATGDVIMNNNTLGAAHDFEVTAAGSISGNGNTLRDQSFLLLNAGGDITLGNGNQLEDSAMHVGSGAAFSLANSGLTDSVMLVENVDAATLTGNQLTSSSAAIVLEGPLVLTGNLLVDSSFTLVNGGATTLTHNQITRGGVQALVLDGTDTGTVLATGNTVTDTRARIVRAAEIEFAAANQFVNGGLWIDDSTQIHLHGNHFSNGEVGLSLERVEDVLVEDNSFLNLQIALRLGGAADAVSENVLILDNHFDTGLNTGIYIFNAHVAGVEIRENLIEGFAQYGVHALGHADLTGNEISNNQIGARITSPLPGLRDNEIHGNTLGLTGPGFLGNDDRSADRHNLVYDNDTGILAEAGAVIAFNRVFENITGIRSASNTLVRHNLVYRNSGASLWVHGGSNHALWNNTVYSPSGTYAVRVSGGAVGTDVRNNLLWSQTGVVLSVEYMSDAGFSSDYNTLFASGTALLGEWIKFYDDLLDWRIETQLDLHSLGTTRIDPLRDQPQFLDVDNDDFRIQDIISPSINGGDPSFAFSHEPDAWSEGSNGVRINQGAYGDTELAALSPFPHLRLLTPDLYLDWERTEPRRIVWQSFGLSGNVTLELHQEGLGLVATLGTVSLTNLPAGVTQQEVYQGSFLWSPNMNGIVGNNDLRYRLRLVAGATVETSREVFTIPDVPTDAPTHLYLAPDGDNRNPGHDPLAPKASLYAFLDNYRLKANMTVHVAEGTYLHIRDVVISSAVALGGNEAFVLQGPETGVALFDRFDGRTGTTGLILDNANFMTVRRLTLAGGHRGVDVRNNSDFALLEDLVVSGHTGVQVQVRGGSDLASLRRLTVENGGTHGIVIEGELAELNDSLIRGNVGTGVRLTQTRDAVIEGNRIENNLGGGIWLSNTLAGTSTRIGNQDLSLERGNLLLNNAGNQVELTGFAVVAGNTISRTQGHPFDGLGRGILGTGQTVLNNVIRRHATGIEMTGGATVQGNRLLNNTVNGIRLSGSSAKTVIENVIEGGQYGVFSSGVWNASGDVFRNNVFHLQTVAGLYIGDGGNLVIENNTFHAQGGHAIHLQSTGAATVRNNIFSLVGGTALWLGGAAQAGLVSDFNLFHLSGGASAGRWESVLRSSYTDWRNASFRDVNSLAADPLFVDATRADGLKLRSDAGSYHTGALAPIAIGDALPFRETAILEMDAQRSPAIDRGHPGTPFGNEPAPNGQFVNLGAFGNTPLASRSPEEYVMLISPQGGETRPSGQAFDIVWRSQDTLGTVLIVLRRDSEPLPVLTLAADAPNTGVFSWTPAGLDAASDYRIEIERDGGISGISAGTFTISDVIQFYYVNDGDVVVDGYTTAPGNNANDGLSPGTPMASLAVLLATYSLSAGDVVFVDAGTYTVTTDIVLTAAMSGIILRGFHDPSRPHLTTVLNRNNRGSGNRIFRIEGALGVTIEHFTLMDAHQAVFAGANAAHDLTLRHNLFLNNGNAGVHIGINNTGLLVENNRFEGTGVGTEAGGGQLNAVNFSGTSAVIRGNEMVWANNTWATAIVLNSSSTVQGTYVIEENLIQFSRNGIRTDNFAQGEIFIRNNTVQMFFTQSIGIEAQGVRTLVRGNTVSGAQIGISLNVRAVAEDNDVFSNTLYGIQLSGSSTARENRVYSNPTGIYGVTSTPGNLIERNEVYGNSVQGLLLQPSAIVRDNHIHSNPTGIWLNTTGGVASSQTLLMNNLLEGNTLRAIRINAASSQVWIWNNTVLQNGSSEAVWIETSGRTDLRNNIFVVEGAASVLRVANAAQESTLENYNLYDLRGSGTLFHWGSASYATLSDWFFATGNGMRSLAGDPLFTDEGSGDYTLSLLSPGVNAGDPLTEWLYEPQGSGGRVNLGHTGNRPQAVGGGALAIDVLDPFALSLPAAGTASEIVFLASGFGEGQTAAWLTVGNRSVENWLHLQPGNDATVFSIFSSEIDRSFVVNPAPDLVYRDYLASNVWGSNRIDLPLTLPEGSYRIRLHFAAPNTGTNVFDIRIDGTTLIGGYNPLTAAGAALRAVTAEISLSTTGDAPVLLTLAAITGQAHLAGLEIFRVTADAPEALFTVQVSTNGGVDWTPVATGVGVDARGIGRVLWTPAAASSGAQIRVVSEVDGAVFGLSDLFQITPAGNTYYVNNASTANNVFTTAAGSNLNNGRSPDAPMASLEALLALHSFSPGDIIFVDSGEYLIPVNLLLTAAASGITIRGAFDPGNPAAVTVLNRDNRSAGAYIFDIQGAENVTLEHLTLMNADRAIHGGANAAHGLTVRHSRFLTNGDAAIRLGAGNTGLLVEHSQFEANNGQAPAGGQIHGIRFEGLSAVIRNNSFGWSPNSGWPTAILLVAPPGSTPVDHLVENNTVTGARDGIMAQSFGHGSVRLIGNDLTLGHSQSYGMRISGAAVLAQGNTVTGAQHGIDASAAALVVGNTVHGNTLIGILAGQGVRVSGNTAYNNPTGIQTSGGSLQQPILVEGNLVYANTGVGLRLLNNTWASHNRIYNNQAGVEIQPGSAGFSQVLFLHNTLYGNSSSAVRTAPTASTGGIWMYQNTFVQSGAGSAALIALNNGELHLRNNIFSVHDGATAIRVHPGGEAGIHEDYNLYHVTTGAQGFMWNGFPLATVSDWFHLSALGRNSRMADPLFVNAPANDYRLLPGSPAVDAGDPALSWLREPGANGGRANLGAEGNTADAVASAGQTLAVLGPAGVDRALVGRATEISFLASGYAPYQSGLFLNAGGRPHEAWLPFLPVSGGVYGSFLESQVLDLSAAGGQVPDGVYREFYASTTVPMTFEVDLPDGAYRLRLHFMTPQNFGLQTFHVDVDGLRVLENYNIFTAAGAMQRLVIEEVDVVVTGGQLTISLIPFGTNHVARISAIEVQRATGAAAETFTVQVSLDDGATFTTLAANVAVDARGVGRLSWVPDQMTSGATARIRVLAGNGAAALSDAFVIAPPGNRFYVNNDSLAGNVYTTAPGSNLNHGRTPDQPLPSLEALLAVYRFQPGDLILIDAGHYTVRRNLPLDRGHDGVTLIGAFDPFEASSVTVLDRNLYGTNYHVMDVAGTRNLTLRHLSFTGAHIGIHVSQQSAGNGADQLRFEHLHVYENTLHGIFLGQNTVAVLVENSVFTGGTQLWNALNRQEQGLTSYAQALTVRDSRFLSNFGWGLRMFAPNAVTPGHLIESSEFTGGNRGIETSTGGFTLQDLHVHGNRDYGIYLNAFSQGLPILRNNLVENNGFSITLGAGIFVGSDALIENNRITGNRAGVRIQPGGTLRGNEISLNEKGIVVTMSNSNPSVIEGNRIFGQSQEGILIQGGSPLIVGNQIYSNLAGILKTGTAAFNGVIENNVIYDNVDKAIGIATAGGAAFRIANNTLYEPAGIGIELSNISSGRVFNNIIQVNAGFGIFVAGNPVNLIVDSNLFHNTGDVAARIGQWNGVPYTTLPQWQAGTGRDAASLFADPLFFDRDGADDVLGYREVAGFFIDGGFDDNFHLLKNSPAIDRGQTYWARRVDFDGDSRRSDPGTPDAGGIRYVETVEESTLFDATRGTAQGWNGTSALRTITLPFAFPYFDATYTQLQLSPTGLLGFPSASFTGTRTAAMLTQNRWIAPLWGNINLFSTGKDIFIDTSVSGEIYIRWEARASSGTHDVRFAVLLRSDGSIRFDYGDVGGPLLPFVGISMGNQVDFHFPAGYSTVAELNQAPSITFSRAPGITDIGAFEFKGDSNDSTSPLTLGTDPAAIENEGLLEALLTEISLLFSEALDSIDARSPATFSLLRDADGNGLFNSLDDVIALRPVYDPLLNRIRLEFPEGPLPEGLYQLRVRSANLRDLSGNELDGDSSGSPGGDYVRVFTVQHPPAEILGVQINGGAAQRSMVTEIRVVFDRDMSAQVTPESFRIHRRDTGERVDPADVRVVWDAAANTAVLSFPDFAGGSLPDGLYTLALLAADFPAGSGLDADGTGSAGGMFTYDFHRLFGDLSGTGYLDTLDLAIARRARNRYAGQTLFVPELDADGSGWISPAHEQLLLDNRSLRLEPMLAPPLLISAPGPTVSASVGQTLDLRIWVAAPAPVTVIWRFESMQIAAGIGLFTLSFPSLTLADFGDYTIELLSETGDLPLVLLTLLEAE